MKRLSRKLLAPLALAASLCFSAVPVSAHAVLLRSEPSNGSVQATGPAAVRLYFNEHIEAEFNPLVVRDQKGTKVDKGDAHLDPGDASVLVVSLRPLANGFYTATYHVTSADGHPVEGTIGFSVGTAAGDGQPARAPVEPAWRVAAAAVAHGVAEAACVALAGLAAFALFVWLPVAHQTGLGAGAAATFRHGLWWLLLLLLVAGVAELSIYAVRASGEALSPGLFAEAVARTRVGHLWLARSGTALLAAAAGAWALGWTQKAAPWVSALCSAGLLFTLTLQSHAAADNRLLTIAADFTHLLAVSPWIGGLLGFTIGLLRPQPAAERSRFLSTAVPRFSRFAVVSVGLLLLTGGYAALLHIPALAGLWTTAYGRSFLIKMALLVPLLALGALNFRRRGQGGFRQAVGLELGLAAGIFLATGFLTSLPPARVALRQALGPFQATQAAGPLNVTLRIDPRELGFNSSTISVRNQDGTPVTDAYVGLRLTMTDPTMNMGVQNPDATASGAPGVYQVDQVVLGMSGNWQVQAVILTKQGQEYRTTFSVDVPEPEG